MNNMNENIQDKEIPVVRICKRCGRKLRTDEARERGMGKVCWEKSQHTVKPRLFYKGADNELPKDNKV